MSFSLPVVLFDPSRDVSTGCPAQVDYQFPFGNRMTTTRGNPLVLVDPRTYTLFRVVLFMIFELLFPERMRYESRRQFPTSTNYVISRISFEF